MSPALSSLPAMQADPPPPRIYYVHPLLLRGMPGWIAAFEHASSLGFDTILSAPPFRRVPGASVFASASFDALDPGLELSGHATDRLAELAAAARERGLRFALDLVLDRVATVSPLPGSLVDPRVPARDRGTTARNFSDPDEAGRCLAEWGERLGTWVEAGVTGFRCLHVDKVPVGLWSELIATHASAEFYAWTPGTAFAARQALLEAGIK
eukprot:gene38038-51371_t